MEPFQTPYVRRQQRENQMRRMPMARQPNTLFKYDMWGKRRRASLLERVLYHLFK